MPRSADLLAGRECYRAPRRPRQNENDVQDIVDDGYHGMEGSFIFGNILAMWLKVCVHVFAS